MFIINLLIIAYQQNANFYKTVEITIAPFIASITIN